MQRRRWRSAEITPLGTLAFCVRRWWFTLLALFMIAGISLSRPYLGVCTNR